MFDAIDFKWNDEKLYKANYMQDPFNILTKENLDKLEKHCKKAIHYERKGGILEHQITLDLLYKYEEQQEEIEKRDKIINKMAEFIDKYMPFTLKTICLQKQKDRNVNSIIEYFEKEEE